MSSMNDSVLYQLPVMDQQYLNTASTGTWLSLCGDKMLQMLSQITITRVIILVLLLGNVKNIPLIWHLRIVNAFRFCCRSQRPKVALTSEHIFQPLITTSRAPIMEIDFNLHKTNSSYFSDIDIARTHLVCTLFSTGIENQRGGTSGYNRGGRPLFGLALGAVSCSFKRELKPYEAYEMWSRILTWDEKWVYIVTHFVRKGKIVPGEYSLYPEQNKTISTSKSGKKGEKGEKGEKNEKKNVKDMMGSAADFDRMATNPAVVATALSKCVFKSGRRTVSPALMLKLSGLLPTKSLSDTLAHSHDLPTQQQETISSTSSDSGIDMDEDAPEQTELQRIEKERQRGMRLAVTLAAQAQDGLEREFVGDNGESALGRHSDGTGAGGVVATLCQLAGISGKQLL